MIQEAFLKLKQSQVLQNLQPLHRRYTHTYTFIPEPNVTHRQKVILGYVRAISWSSNTYVARIGYVKRFRFRHVIQIHFRIHVLKKYLYFLCFVVTVGFLSLKKKNKSHIFSHWLTSWSTVFTTKHSFVYKLLLLVRAIPNKTFVCQISTFFQHWEYECPND